MIKHLTRSLSFRLLAIFLVMGLLFAYGAILGVRWVYLTDDLRDLVSGHLSLHLEYVKRDIGNPPNVQDALNITQTVPVDIRILGPNVDWASDDEFPEIGQLHFGDSDVFSNAADAWLADLENVEFAQSGSHGFLKIRQGSYDIVVSTPKISDHPVRRQLTPIIMGFGLVLVLLAYLAVRWLFRPIEAIRTGAAQIGEGNLSHRISDIRHDQLGDLAHDINQMAGDVQQMLDAKRQLLLGISHELRTPLSRMNLELALLEESVEVAGMQAHVNEMENIISILLEAERLSGKHQALRRTLVVVSELVNHLIETFFKEHSHRIRVSIVQDVTLSADSPRLTLLLKNLISNALRYSESEDSPVDISVEANNHDCWISVSDLGPGLDPSQADKIGEPFHRGDPSRNRQTGGTGLGLYLAQTIAQAHSGQLHLDQGYTQGARFVVRLPVTN